MIYHKLLFVLFQYQSRKGDGYHQTLQGVWPDSSAQDIWRSACRRREADDTRWHLTSCQLPRQLRGRPRICVAGSCPWVQALRYQASAFQLHDGEHLAAVYNSDGGSRWSCGQVRCVPKAVEVTCAVHRQDTSDDRSVLDVPEKQLRHLSQH